MSQPEQSVILESLEELSEQVRQSENLLSNGEDLAALQRILETKELIRRIVVTLVVQCLRRNLEVINSEVSCTSETQLRHLSELVKFTLQALCLNCQEKIGNRLKEA